MFCVRKKTLRSKAFTLIELMGVIILLSIIAIIALTVVNKNIRQSEEVLYNTQINNIIDGAKNWSADNIKALPSDDDKSIFLTLAQLKQGGYVEDNIKSPSNDKKCFPNDLEIEIVASAGGKYEYKINTDNITYVSCEDEDYDRTSPYIILGKGDAINKNNEVIDYVEVDQNSKYEVKTASAYDKNGNPITDSNAFSAVVYYKDEGSNDYIEFGTYSSSNGSITINDIDIKNYKRVYKIEYSINYDDNKKVKAVRNIILQDTKAPVITIKKTEDVILYYSDSGVQTIDYVFSQASVSDNSSSSLCTQGDNGSCYYELSGVENINSYFNSDEFKAIPRSDYVSFSKSFPVIVTAVDAAGNTSKKSQNIKFTLNEVKEPSIKLLDTSSTVVYDTSDSSIIFEDKWRTDDKFTVKVESGCAIDDLNSYYKYDGNTIYFNTLGLSNKFDISFDITLKEGQKDLEVYATCGSDVDKSLFNVTDASIPTTNVKVDRNAPQCIIDIDGTYNNDTGYYTSKPTITYTLSDTNGVSGKFSNNGIISDIDITTNYSQSVTVTEDGSYTYSLEGTDVVGKNCSISKTINVDSTPPTVTFTGTSSYPLRNKFVSKIIFDNQRGKEGGWRYISEIGVMSDENNILSTDKLKSAYAHSCSSASNNDTSLLTAKKNVYNNFIGLWNGVGYGAGIYNGKADGCGSRTSGISIYLNAVYPIYQWYVKSDRFFNLYRDYCSYDDTKILDDKGGYLGYDLPVLNIPKNASDKTDYLAINKIDYCSYSELQNHISAKNIIATNENEFLISEETYASQESGQEVQVVRFTEKGQTNLNISYSDNVGVDITDDLESEFNNITGDVEVSAKDINGNEAICKYIYSSGECSCTAGTCN